MLVPCFVFFIILFTCFASNKNGAKKEKIIQLLGNEGSFVNILTDCSFVLRSFDVFVIAIQKTQLCSLAYNTVELQNCKICFYRFCRLYLREKAFLIRRST